MAITGNLRTMQLSELLQWLSMGQKTGTLVVRGTPGEKRVYFRDGRIISSSSTVEREYLGHFLVAYGYITEEELTKAMQVQRESKILLGKILVMIGAITEDALTELIRLKAAETIYDIFLWGEGAFEFIDREIPQLPMVPISVDVTGIVMEGLRRYDEWQRIRTRIRSLRQVCAVTSPVALTGLPEREKLVLAAIDGVRSIDEIAFQTHNPDFVVAKFVFELLEAGRAELVGERPDEAHVPADLTLEDPAAMVFEEAATPAYEPVSLPEDGSQPAPEELAPPPGAEPSARTAPDFSRFLRRGPDSFVESSRAGGRAAARPPSGAWRQPSGGFSTPSGAFTAPSGALRRPSDALERGGPRPASPSTAIPPVSPAPQASEEKGGRAAIPVTAVPTLTKPLEDLMSHSFTPNEAFILSRVNGLWDVRSIVKISPFPEQEVLRVFEKLQAGGVIALR
ncbi:MAG: DUF4388 domain-containing protein [Acidobacteria bacterium]|nr:MAG: DUF4388 domain-containing protein [Acidobacteriota bacterium]